MIKHVFVLLCCTFSLVAVSAAAQEKKLTLLYTNDIHARVHPHIVRYVDASRKVGGFANIASYVKQYKSEYPGTLFLDAGDYFAGSTMDTLSQGESIIDIMNQMSYDAVSIGNHEFDYGWDNMLVQLSRAKYDVLLGNVFYAGSDKPLWDKPYTIVERNGLKVGVIGMHGVFAFYDTVSAEMRQHIEARDEVRLTQQFINKLSPLVDITVLLVHEGTPARQSSYGNADVRRGLDKDIRMAEQLKGLDVLVTGHAHVGTPAPIEVNNTLIVSTDAYGINVGRLALTFDTATASITGYQFELKTIWDDEWQADPATQAVIEHWDEQMAERTAKVVATFPAPLTRSYGESSPLGNLVADALLTRFPGAQLAFTNSGGIRADINAGEVSVAEVIDALPFQNYPVLMTMKGSQIRAVLEHAAGLTNGVLQTSSGMYYQYDSSLPKGQRVTGILLNNQPLDVTRTYQVATNNFLADGGDGFTAFTEGEGRHNLAGEYLFQTVSAYLQTLPDLRVILEQRRVHDTSLTSQ